ncbi:phenylalanine--tRNA ligase subunit alpha [candidate division CPR3 bacterium 4484_211]|uniref:Phenylalanine--tRNA ligase alpha subunit n=1 Tax=candidate division CPR3 bacterium 4484_211 TaxID=1968527 RepID=A0A1W9P0T5_UNCC3|nr:MAG: phenylalanine--tRNA ligase subunit alpha [candidate division CPR3 bacterium 4484_211]
MNKQTINELNKRASRELEKLLDLDKLREWKRQYLGKKGLITQLIKQLPGITDNKRPEIGRQINQIKNDLKKAYDRKMSNLQNQPPKTHRQEPNNWFDLTAPGEKTNLGHLHPITQMRQYAEDIFTRMGFEIFEAREVDDDYHNFESLNMPPQHPARDIWDTFWTNQGLVLITHTSSMQNRILSTKEPPLRAVIVGRCFRNEATDARHEHTLHQIEGLLVDRGITLRHLIGVFKAFLDEFYQRDVSIKIQPSYFPFVEPGIEFLIDCTICRGKGTMNKKQCSTCGGSGWIELAGAGMIHPKVLKEAGIDPQKYSGFAWGFGLDRLVMMKYGIEDIRHFHSGDLRFIRQF